MLPVLINFLRYHQYFHVVANACFIHDIHCVVIGVYFVHGIHYVVASAHHVVFPLFLFGTTLPLHSHVGGVLLEAKGCCLLVALAKTFTFQVCLLFSQN
jgi:hypothetical protein